MSAKIICNTTCRTTELPKCVVQDIYDSIALEDILYNQCTKITKVFVCPKNALKVIDSKVFADDLCDNCSLCKFTCKKQFVEFKKLEKTLFRDLSKLNIFLKSLATNITIASAVKVPGNSRNKRLDIVIKKNNKIYFMKVLNNLDKYNFYKRSYNDVIEEYSAKYPNFEFIFIALLPGSECKVSEHTDTLSLENVYSKFSEEKDGIIIK